MSYEPDQRHNHHLVHQAFRAINKAGRKARAWARDLKALEKEALLNGVFEIKEVEYMGKKLRLRMGICCDCNHYKHLTPDHVIKRSQGGDNQTSNIDWCCRECHDKRDNQGDPMNKKTPGKQGSKASTGKAGKKFHPCKKCKQTTGMILCDKCGEISL